MATSLGLSRTTVREALRLLAAEGVVELVHNRGARVVSWSAEDIDEAYRLRAPIEGYGARLAAGRADSGCVAELDGLPARVAPLRPRRPPRRQARRLGFGFSTATGRGRSLLAAVEFLARELDQPGGIAETPLAREQLEAFVTTQVLLAVPNSYSDVLEGYVARSRPSRLQAVLAHMETHADQPLTPGDLARVGCMSVRSLHATFRHELGLSPMAP